VPALSPGPSHHDPRLTADRVAGGGVDFNLSPHFAGRVFDADYYRTSLFSAHQNNIWLSTCFVIRLDGARPE